MARACAIAASVGMPCSERIKSPGESWAKHNLGEDKAKAYHAEMDEGRKRVVGIIAGILMSRNLNTPGDLFGGPQGSPRTDKMIAASVQWATLIMKKVDAMVKESPTP
jgi:hypothetical protein